MSGDRLWKRKIPVKGSAEADFLLHSSATEQKKELWGASLNRILQRKLLSPNMYYSK